MPLLHHHKFITKKIICAIMCIFSNLVEGRFCISVVLKRQIPNGSKQNFLIDQVKFSAIFKTKYFRHINQDECHVDSGLRTKH